MVCPDPVLQSTTCSLSRRLIFPLSFAPLQANDKGRQRCCFVPQLTIGVSQSKAYHFRYLCECSSTASLAVHICPVTGSLCNFPHSSSLSIPPGLSQSSTFVQAHNTGVAFCDTVRHLFFEADFTQPLGNPSFSGPSGELPCSTLHITGLFRINRPAKDP